MSNELVKTERVSPPAPTFDGGNPIGAMMNGLLERANTPEMLTAATAMVKDMLQVYNQQEDRQAQRDFSADLASLQSDIPTQIAMKEVRNKEGLLRYKYQPLPALLAAIKPILCRYGFAIYTDSRWDNDRGVAIVELIHRSGHSRKTEYAVVRSAAAPGGNMTEAEEGTLTRAVRRGICAALNIPVSQDDVEDAKDIGERISPEKAGELQQRCEALGPKFVKRVLAFAESDTFDGIYECKLAELETKLSNAEAYAKSSSAPTKPTTGDLFGDGGKYFDLIEAVNSDVAGCTRQKVQDAIEAMLEAGEEVTVDSVTDRVRQ